MKIHDEDDYSVSNSDDEYTENEKNLLNKVRHKDDDSDHEQEVFGVTTDHSDDEDDSDENELALSDVEGQEEDDLPDIRAWGKDRRKYYQTDYVDGDYGGFQGKDAQLAELEEEEARTLQKQLAQHLDDDDFNLDIFKKKIEGNDRENEEIVKTDISKLSKRQKLEILQKESPEFFNLVADFQSKMKTAKTHLLPLIKKVENKQITQCQGTDLVQILYELTLNYCTNIYMYLLLKTSKINIQNHPIIRRLYQYRQLLLQLEPVYEEVIEPQIELLLTTDNKENGDEDKSKKKMLKLLGKIKNKPSDGGVKRKQPDLMISNRIKKVKFDESSLVQKENEITSSGEEETEHVENAELENMEDKQGEPSKRAITYQMAKNKGLTPHRKKEQRNPRVKHKLKYRKAIIRRKGAVREPRKELSRYGGEISGIKTNVSRSIKIKT